MAGHGSLFDIMGPVMVGPSSSHTAGAVRLGALARNVANCPIQSVIFTLYNSFAKTYQGHGTDKGLLAGILGFSVQDEAIRDVYQAVAQAGLKYEFVVSGDNNQLPPNTVLFDMVLDNGETLRILGHSLGGGKVYVSRINDYNVSIRGEYPTLVMFYHDEPGMIWRVTKVIAEQAINIATLTCTRKDKGTEAFMIICLDTLLSAAQVDEIAAIPGVYSIRNVDKIPE